MKKVVFFLALSFLLSSCIVVKVYDTPEEESNASKVIAKRQIMLPSDRTITLPTGEQDILFFGGETIPEPELFHGEVDTLMIDFKGDHLAHKGGLVFKEDIFPLVIIDGEEQAEDYDFGSLSVENIERIDVLKDEAAIKKVGEKGINGVIIITTKKN